MAKQNSKAPKIKIGDLKNVVSGLQERTKKLQGDYDRTREDIRSGMTIGQRGIGEMQDLRSREIQHNSDKINRYSRIIDSTTIAHDKARLAEKQAKFNRDYPLSPTFKSEMSAPTKKQTSKLPKGIAKEGISEAVSSFKQKK